jgi:hypothetical protein
VDSIYGSRYWELDMGTPYAYMCSEIKKES